MVSRLGQSAMGAVYKAHNPVIGRNVAIKLVPTQAPDAVTRREYLARFRAEAQAAERCNHPAIVAIYDVSTEGEHPFIVMELVEGANLAGGAARSGTERRDRLPRRDRRGARRA
ncbi:MAG: protein kinase [Rhodospirillales bacterium]|nr:protein kinase [Rhodospirillales bacterium]